MGKSVEMTAGGTAPGDATGSYHGAVHQREGEPSAYDVQPAALEGASGLDLGAPAPVLVLEHATKSFGAVHALVDGDIELRSGETHGLVGENGAGPEMRDALSAAGWHNYSLFLDATGLLTGYFECEDLDQAQQAMEMAPVNARWQAEMAEYFAGLGGGAPDRGIVPVPEISHLE